MNTQEYISLEIFCQHYQVTPDFMISMEEIGLIEFITTDNNRYIATAQLTEAEMLARLHTDLDINPAGIDVTWQLLQRMKSMQEEIRVLRNRLSFFDTGV